MGDLVRPCGRKITPSMMSSHVKWQLTLIMIRRRVVT